MYRGATKLTATPTLATFYNDSGLQFGTMYTYTVKAVVNNAETAGVQISDTTHPSTATPVQNLTITGATVSSLSLTWDAPAQTGGNFNGYTIYRGSTKCNVSPTYTSSYTDTGLTANTAYTYTVKVVVDNAEQSSASVSGTTTAASTGTRSAVYYPFSSDSPWNLPVVQNAATYDQPILRSVGSGVNYTSWGHGVVNGTASDPLVTVTDTNNHIPQTTWHIPDSAVPAVGSDVHMHVINPEGTIILEMYGVQRVDATHLTCIRASLTDLYSSGLGPDKGVRAYGGSAIGELIRAEEADPADPRYTGEIRHAIAFASSTGQLGKNAAAWDGQYGYYYDNSLTDATHQPGWIAGKNRNKFMHLTGYVWPVTEQDSNSFDSDWGYTGSIPMGAYFVIPATVTIATLGITTTAGLMVAKAAQDYGVYIVDATGKNGWNEFYVDYTPETASKTDAFSADLAAEASKIVAQLRRVTTNDENNPNGGPIGATRRQPLLPALQ